MNQAERRTRRISVMVLAAGIALMVIAWLLTRAGATAMPSYLADWLFWSALPFGALPVVMLIDLAGPGAGFALEPALRRLLLLLPIAALLIIPILLHPAAVFGWAAGHGFSTPFGRYWMARPAFIIRDIIILVLWALLAFVFFFPPAPSAIERRRAFAAIGLFIYALTITLMAADWAMVVEPDWLSAEFGILFAVSQIAIAISFAVLLAGADWRIAAPEAAASYLLGAVGLWVFAHFIQYLVIWSGDKPNEISWYLQRSDLGSVIAVWAAVLLGVVAPLAMLLPWQLRRRPGILPAASILIIIAQALGMLWLITPSLRHDFIISGMDVLEICGLGAISLGVYLLAGPVAQPVSKDARHA
jgi:hypothetical protein